MKEKRKKRKKSGGIRSALPYFAIIFVAAGLIFAVLMVTGRRGIHDQRKPSAVELNQDSQPYNSGERVIKDGNPQIAELIRQYFEAAKSADVETLNKIIWTEHPFEEEKLKKESEYIESYSNISCYTTPGILPDTYVTYIYYEYKLLGIDTKAPSMIRFYICTDESGMIYINNNTRSWSAEVQTFMQEVANWPEIRELIADVNTRMQEACASDEKLKGFMNMLNGNEATMLEEVTTTESSTMGLNPANAENDMAIVEIEEITQNASESNEALISE